MAAHGRATIDRFFSRQRFRARLGACMLAPYWDDLAAWLTQRGHPDREIYHTIRFGLRFAECVVEEEGVHDPALLTEALIARHEARYAGRARVQREFRIYLRRLLAFLRERGIAAAAPLPQAEHSSPVLHEYVCHLAQHRGIGEKSIARHRLHVLPFLEAVQACETRHFAHSVDANAVCAFVTARAQTLCRHQRKSMCAALRSFLRFLHLRGYVAQDLSAAVPVIPTFKLDRLPVVIGPEHVAKILLAVDRTTAVGRRDYALLLLLATYGLRAGQLCALRLEDFDWRQQILRIHGVKGGEDVLLPLRPAVGEAVIAYLRKGRPAGASSRVLFLRVRAPIGPLRGNLSNVIKRYAQLAGLTQVPLGPHAWRHAVASRMLATGQSLKTIRDTLGHRSIETTFIYTKVDVEQLRAASLDWPWMQP